MNTSNWGRALHTALSEQPSLSLDFYSYIVLLRKHEGDALTEYAVDPAQVAVTLAVRVVSPFRLLISNAGVRLAA